VWEGCLAGTLQIYAGRYRFFMSLNDSALSSGGGILIFYRARCTFYRADLEIFTPLLSVITLTKKLINQTNQCHITPTDRSESATRSATHVWRTQRCALRSVARPGHSGSQNRRMNTAQRRSVTGGALVLITVLILSTLLGHAKARREVETARLH
jgi:hypothetical protein